MKKWTFILIIAALISGCNEDVFRDKINVAGGGYQGIDGETDDILYGRIGWAVDPNIEIGGGIIGNPPMEKTSGLVYGAWYPPLDFEVPVPGDINWLPDEIITRPYIILQGDFEFTNKKLRIMPVPGVLINGLFTVEYWKDTPETFGAEDEDYVVVGLSHRF